MKKKNIAMLLAISLTLTQVMAVPAAAEGMPVGTGWEQEAVPDDSAADVTTGEDEAAAKANVEADSSDDTEADEEVDVPDDAEDGEADSPDDAEEDVEISIPNETEEDTEFIIQNDAEGRMAAAFSLDAPTAEQKQYGFARRYEGSIGNGAMLPNSTMTISVSLIECINNDWPYVEETYTLEVEASRSDIVAISLDQQNHRIEITSHDQTGFVELTVKAKMNGEIVFTEMCVVEVSQYMISPQTLKGSDEEPLNPQVNETIDLSQAGIQLLQYVRKDTEGNDQFQTITDTDNFKLEVATGGQTPEGGTYVDYDTNGWELESVEGQTLPKMTRKTEESTWFAVTAMKRDEEGSWNQIARFTYEFASLNVWDEWYEDNSEEQSNYALNVFYQDTTGIDAMRPNSQMTIKTELLDKTNEYSQVSDYKLVIKKATNFGTATVGEDGKTITIASKGRSGTGNCYVAVQIPGENGEYQEVFKKNISFTVSKYKLTPQTLEDSEGNPLNPQKGETIDLSQAGIVLQVCGEDGNFTAINDMSNFRIEVSVSESWCDYDEEGWELTPIEGSDLPKMTRKTEDGTWFTVTAKEKNTSGGWSQVAKLQYNFASLSEGDEWHHDDRMEESDYELAYDCQDSIGNGAMLPNSTMTIGTDLMDRTDEYSSVKDYKLEILNKSKFGTATLGADGKTITITSKDRIGTGCCYVSVLLPDGDGGYEEVFTQDISFEVSKYMISPQTLSDSEGNPLNPTIENSIDLSTAGIELLEYGADKQLHPVAEPSKFKFEVFCDTTDEDDPCYDYDEEGWELTPIEGSDLPKMTRKTEDSTWFAVTAMEKNDNDQWNQVARLEYNFESLPGYGEEDGSEVEDRSDVWNGDDKSEIESNYELWVTYSYSYYWEDAVHNKFMNFPDLQTNGVVAPNSDLVVTTDLRDKTANGSKVTDYKLVMVKDSDIADAMVGIDGKTLTIHSEEYNGDGYCTVSVQIPDGKGGYKEAFKRDIFFSVLNTGKEINAISPSMLLDKKTGRKLNPKVGESINLLELGVGLVEYSCIDVQEEDKDGNRIEIGRTDKIIHPVGDPDLEVYVSGYDPNGWKVTPIKGSDLSIMTRTTKNPTWFTVTAKQWIRDEETGEIIDSSVSAVRSYFFSEAEEPVHTHSWKKGNVTKEPTCTEKGIRTDTCVCGGKMEVAIPAKGHSEVKDAAVAATALAAGKTEGSHCSACPTVLKKQNTVAKLTPKISLTASSLQMRTGQRTSVFKAAGFAAGDYVTKVTSGNTGIVNVSNVKKDGTFTLTAGTKRGSTTVSVYLASSSQPAKTFRVTVQRGAVKTTQITSSVKNLTLKKGETYKKLASSVSVAPVTSKEKITYSSSKKSVATVNSKGEITAKKAGTTKITIKSGKKKAVVTVKVNPIKTTKLSGVPESKKIRRGKSFKINAKATPKNTDEKITYKSSNEKVAKVSSKGVVKGRKKGTATITVKSGSRVLTCKVTVK